MTSVSGIPLRCSDDAALINESMQSPEAFASLYNRHAPALFKYAARRLGESAADDIVGETFLKAFAGRRGYDLSRRDAAPWLYRIASNLIARHRRAEVRAYRAYCRTGMDPLAMPPSDSADVGVTTAALRRELAGALAGLSRGDRDVLLLIAWAELPYHEVAEALDIPVGTVRSRLNRARKKVRAALGDTTPLMET